MELKDLPSMLSSRPDGRLCAQLPLRGIARPEGGEVVRQVSECRVVLLVVVATGCRSPIYVFLQGQLQLPPAGEGCRQGRVRRAAGRSKRGNVVD